MFQTFKSLGKLLIFLYLECWRSILDQQEVQADSSTEKKTEFIHQTWYFNSNNLSNLIIMDIIIMWNHQ